MPSCSFVSFTNAVLCKSVYFSVISKCTMYANLRPSVSPPVPIRFRVTNVSAYLFPRVRSSIDVVYCVNTLRDNFLLRFSSVIFSSSFAVELRGKPICISARWNVSVHVTARLRASTRLCRSLNTRINFWHASRTVDSCGTFRVYDPTFLSGYVA